MKLKKAKKLGLILVAMAMWKVEKIWAQLEMAPTITERGPHQQRVSYGTSAPGEGGGTVEEWHSYVEVATGLNRWNGAEWVAADPNFEIINGVGVLRFTQHKAIVAETADAPEGLVDLEMPDGGRLVLRPVGIAITDDTGRSLFLGEVQASTGELVAPNAILFRDAFDTIRADIFIHSHLSRIESDIVMRERLDAQMIGAAGLNPDVADEQSYEAASVLDSISGCSVAGQHLHKYGCLFHGWLR